LLQQNAAELTRAARFARRVSGAAARKSARRLPCFPSRKHALNKNGAGESRRGRCPVCRAHSPRNFPQTAW